MASSASSARPPCISHRLPLRSCPLCLPARVRSLSLVLSSDDDDPRSAHPPGHLRYRSRHRDRTHPRTILNASARSQRIGAMVGDFTARRWMAERAAFFAAGLLSGSRLSSNSSLRPQPNTSVTLNFTSVKAVCASNAQLAAARAGTPVLLNTGHTRALGKGQFVI